jgi:hypothetical protein
LVHEAIHVYQFERIGTLYIGQALHAQWRLGRACYRYGGPAGLRQAWRAGRRYCTFNREAQAQIAQDYYRRRQKGEDVSAYTPYVAALTAGAF